MLLTIPIILPAVLGILLCAVKLPTRRWRDVLTCLSALISAAAMWAVILTDNGGSITLIKMSETVAITLRLDGLGKIFAGLASALWPVTALYAVEYMRGDKNVRAFSGFFLISMAATMGIALSGTMLSMYFFYELLTLSTLPLVIHGMTEKSKKAGIYYLCYSIGGAAFAFIAVAFSVFYGGGGFVMGGSLSAEAFGNENLAMVIYVLSFMGFGVKAAVFPFHAWLQKASVAPTPVTALLHAVAVVKAGAFAVIRLTYYTFGAEFLAGTWAQQVVMGVTVVTIIFGSTMALKERHLKRRLAYSTCANLSYILFGAAQMSPSGLVGGVAHILFHSIFKIGAFFAVGAVLHNTHREYVDDLDGLGRKMPVTFVCFTVFGLALMGVAPFNGFISKWDLTLAAMDTASVMSFLGICALLYSAMMAAIYMLTVSVRAFFPRKTANLANNARVREVNGFMTVPMLLFALLSLATGLMGGQIVGGVTRILGL